jgi:hypothetical protein
MEKRFTTTIVFIVIAVIITGLGLSISNQTAVDTIKDCKVIELQQQQLIKGTGKDVSTEIRYLVITDKETFICENSFLNGKFNNSDVFWHLRKDSIYSFKVAGQGKSIFFDYRNILEVIK